MVQTINTAGSYTAQTKESKQTVRKGRRVLNRRGVAALTGAGAALFAIAGGIVAFGTVQPHSTLSVPVVSVPLTVNKGDSLWSLARRYGNPQSSILDRVDNLAKANEMPTGSKLVPGQRLLIPVSNPVELARLPHNPAFTTTAQAAH